MRISRDEGFMAGFVWKVLINPRNGMGQE
jgi:hypothetical protein